MNVSFDSYTHECFTVIPARDTLIQKWVVIAVGEKRAVG